MSILSWALGRTKSAKLQPELPEKLRKRWIFRAADTLLPVEELGERTKEIGQQLSRIKSRIRDLIGPASAEQTAENAEDVKNQIIESKPFDAIELKRCQINYVFALFFYVVAISSFVASLSVENQLARVNYLVFAFLVALLASGKCLTFAYSARRARGLTDRPLDFLVNPRMWHPW